MSMPYLTVAEFRQAMSGELLTAFDDNALASLLVEASAWASEQCFQKLEATIDTETLALWPPSRRAVWRPDGTIHVTTSFSPIIAITAFELSFDGVTFQPVNWTTQIKTRQSFIAFPAGSTIIPSSPYGSPTTWVRFTYLDGYPNAFLSEAELAAETEIDVDDATGIVAGSQLHIYDTGAGTVASEDIVVASGYTSGLTIPLVSPLTYGHAAGTRVSAMPAAVKNACVIRAQENIDVPGRRQLITDSSGAMHSVQSAPSQLPVALKDLIRYARSL